MKQPAGTPNPKRETWLSALSFLVGILLGAVVGPFAFFALYLLAIPVGVLVGGIVGGAWGRRNPITVTGFASLSILPAAAVFILGERFLPLPVRVITWCLAPIFGVLGLWLLPRLAEKMWPEQRTRENYAMAALLLFLLTPVAAWKLMPQSQAERDSASGTVQLNFFQQCDALAEREGYHATPTQPAYAAPHLIRLRSFPELCCPGIVAPMRNREVGMGNARIAMHFVTTASFANTFDYYQRLLKGASQTNPLGVSFPCMRVSGSLRGKPVSVVIGDIPERGVGVTIF
jgi:hypothetical protein